MQMTRTMAAPHHETIRLAALEACGIMHTPREAGFDNIVFTAAQLFGVPMVTLNLVGVDNVWAKAAVGVARTTWQKRETFCNVVIETGTPLVVEDAALDPRFANLPSVTGRPHIRFFAGAPIYGPDQQAIGGLCLADLYPRMVPQGYLVQLQQLAIQAGELLCFRVSAADGITDPTEAAGVRF